MVALPTFLVDVTMVPTSNERRCVTGKPAIEPSISTQSLPSQRFANPVAVFRPLHIPMQKRLYHHLFRGSGASSRLALLPCGIVVTPSDLGRLGSGLAGLAFPRIHPILRSRLLGKAPNFQSG